MRHSVHAEFLSAQTFANSKIRKITTSKLESSHKITIAIEERVALMLMKDCVILTDRGVEPGAGLTARGVNRSLRSLLTHYSFFSHLIFRSVLAHQLF